MIAINPNWLVTAQQNLDYHQGGIKCYFLTYCFLMIFTSKSSVTPGFVNNGGIKG
ncbi:TPA: hypothetical protein MFM05_001455 [Klebsiella pneumoniae]|nr:hypothetical protein HMPREF1619_05180 [Klebsiella pneumoniae 909957]HBW8345273.1 hypothetical protein [Klebsiella pneumoniae]